MVQTPIGLVQPGRPMLPRRRNAFVLFETFPVEFAGERQLLGVSDACNHIHSVRGNLRQGKGKF